MRPKKQGGTYGRQSDEALQLADADELVNYLMGAHCAYMQWRELTYYLY